MPIDPRNIIPKPPATQAPEGLPYSTNYKILVTMDLTKTGDLTVVVDALKSGTLTRRAEVDLRRDDSVDLYLDIAKNDRLAGVAIVNLSFKGLLIN